MWQPITTAPFDRDLQLAVINGDGPHSLVFPCRQVLGGWTKAATLERVEVHPTHWQPWGPAALAAFITGASTTTSTAVQTTRHHGDMRPDESELPRAGLPLPG